MIPPVSYFWTIQLGHNFNVKVLKRVVKSRCAWDVIFLWLNKWIRLQLCRNSETKQMEEAEHKVVRKQETQRDTYRLFTVSTETVSTLKTGDLQLVSIIDESI